MPSLALALLAAIALAGSAGAAEINKFETPTPPGVVIPDTLETRFGTLHFFCGFPDAASVDKLYDNLDFQRAVQAYLLALPVVSQVANRDNILTAGLANVTVPIWEQMVDAKTTEFTANNNTPYTWFWLDLHDGPIVVEAPPKVFGLADDMRYKWVGDIGLTGPDHGEGGKFLFLPPEWKGEQIALTPGAKAFQPHRHSNFVFSSKAKRRRKLGRPVLQAFHRFRWR